jgi:hypothetical protein
MQGAVDLGVLGRSARLHPSFSSPHRDVAGRIHKTDLNTSSRCIRDGNQSLNPRCNCLLDNASLFGLESSCFRINGEEIASMHNNDIRRVDRQ